MKRISLFLFAAVCIGSLYGIYLFNKKPVNTREHNADFEISASDLVKDFSDNEEMATKKYVDKILVVRGQIKEINTSASTLFLDGSDPLTTITCSLYADEANQLKKIKLGDLVQVKGKCTGKLIDIIMNNCILTESK